MVECGLPKLPASQACSIMMSNISVHDFTKCCGNVPEMKSSSLSWCYLWSGNHHGGGQFTISLNIPERHKTAFFWSKYFTIKLFQMGDSLFCCKFLQHLNKLTLDPSWVLCFLYNSNQISLNSNWAKIQPNYWISDESRMLVLQHAQNKNRS